MANLKEENKWEEGIYQLEVTDPVVGGIDGISNKQAKQLANRTKFLKESIDALADGKLGKKETAVDSQKLDGKAADAFAQLAEENTFTKNLTIGSEGVIHANNNGSHFLIEAKNKGEAIGLGTPKPDGSPVWHYFTHEGFRTEASVNAGILKIKGVNTDEIYLKKDEASDGTPIGAYLAWSSESKIPAGYLLCDGRSLKKSEYTELFAVIGYTYGGSGDDFNIPKFNDGRFMRGTGGNAAALGIAQGDAIRNITGTLPPYDGGALPNGAQRGAFKYVEGGGNVVIGASNVRGYQTFDASRVVPTAEENRPFNSSVIVLIKVKDVKEPNKNEVDKSIYATETKAGIIKIKNSITGVQEDVAVSEKAVAGIVSIGINQTWQDMLSQRKNGIVYTNTTGRPMQILVSQQQSSTSQTCTLIVNDVEVLKNVSYGTADGCIVSAIIPAGATYKITYPNYNPIKWYELR